MLDSKCAVIPVRDSSLESVVLLLVSSLSKELLLLLGFSYQSRNRVMLFLIIKFENSRM